MRTSARNQFPGKVSAIKAGAVNDEIELDAAGGHTIVAIITHASTQELGLQAGADALALVKASSIILVTAHEGRASRRATSCRARCRACSPAR
jgi:molybdate transport system regulatory protein